MQVALLDNDSGALSDSHNSSSQSSSGGSADVPSRALLAVGARRHHADHAHELQPPAPRDDAGGRRADGGTVDSRVPSRSSGASATHSEQIAGWPRLWKVPRWVLGAEAVAAVALLASTSALSDRPVAASLCALFMWTLAYHVLVLGLGHLWPWAAHKVCVQLARAAHTAHAPASCLHGDFTLHACLNACVCIPPLASTSLH